MTEHDTVREALGTLIADAPPIPFTAAGIARTSRRRHRRRVALTALAVAVAVPLSAYAVVPRDTATLHVATPPAPPVPPLTLPKPCVSVSSRYVPAGVGPLLLTLLPGAGGRVTGYQLDCFHGTRTVTYTGSDPTEGRVIGLTVHTRAGHPLPGPNQPRYGDDVPFYLSLPNDSGLYFAAVFLGPYAEFQVSAQVGVSAPTPYPFRSDAELRRFLNDPRFVAAARLLAG